MICYLSVYDTKEFFLASSMVPINQSLKIDSLSVSDRDMRTLLMIFCFLVPKNQVEKFLVNNSHIVIDDDVGNIPSSLF